MNRTFAAIAALIITAAAHADMVTIAPAKDNTLYQDAAGSLSNGAGPGFFVGATQALAVRRGLVAFDVAAAVPTGSTITGATLTLHMSSTQTTPIGIDMRRVLSNWGEGTSNAGVNGGGGAPSTTGDATWIHTFFPSSFWTTPGGDFSPTASATQTVGGVGFYSWSSPGLVADVQAFLNSPGSNFGWLLIGGEGTTGSAKRFDSREITTPSFQPSLQITYTPIPAPGTLGLLILAGAFRRRR